MAMRHWFPFTDYDFYGYLASGFVLLFTVDFVLTDGSIMLRRDWTFVEIVLVVALAYFTGQIAAAPSSIVLEHWLARRVLRPPIALMLAMAPMRRMDRFIARCVVGRYYEPLPEATRRTVLAKVAAANNVPVEEVATDPEVVFGPAFAVACKHEGAKQRMDEFLNLYGLNRNMSFTALLACGLFFGKAISSCDSQSYTWSGLTLLLAVGLFARFLKFYSAFSAEILRTFAFAGENEKGEAS